MKISFVMIVFQSDFVLEPCLRSVLPFGQVYAAEGPVKFWQEHGYTTSIDQTTPILNRYRVPTIHGQWAEKDEQSNAALALVPHDTDFVFVLDSDEIWPEWVLTDVCHALESNQYDSMSFKANSFYGGFERIMGGFEENFEVHRIQRYYPRCEFATHRPPTILSPIGGQPWRELRHIGHERTDKNGWRFFHYSYVFPSQMDRKAQYYKQMGGNISDYLDRVYLPWVMGNDEQKAAIENEFDGVHNWLPKRRGPCRTRRFEGVHPAEIERVMPELLRRFEFELGATNEC